MAGNDSDQIMVKAKRPFEGAEGYKDDRSEPFGVSRLRLAELKANDLVEEDAPAVTTLAENAAKQAPEPDNKMAPAPVNKVRPESPRASKP